MTLQSNNDTLITVFGGSGFLGRHLVRALARRHYRIRVAVRRPDLAGHLQPLGRVGQIHPVQANVRHPGSVEAAVRGADVVCLCTSATAPVVAPGWLAPGAHVTSVGYAPPGGELDPAIARAGRLLVETRDAFAPPPAGCAELAGLDPADAAELGEVVAGTRAGRVADDALTVYKSMGSVVEDLAAADVVIRRAEALGAGRRIPF